MKISDYWKCPSSVKKYIITDKNWELIEFKDWYKASASRVLEEDTLSREQDREKLSYLTFLDRYTNYFNILSSLPDRQAQVLNTIFNVYVEKGIRNKLNVENIWTWNDDFYDKLKMIIDNISFEWINQSDIAQLLWTNQSNISQHFKALL